ncbi:hypothetical protein ABZ618_31635 [Streptomyces roseolus]|uniref:hypothetical protein n=1 Tax=Streptomyces roseolus TaxID=67358 RepID=UPI0033C030A0
MDTDVAKPGTLLKALRPGSRAIVRVTVRTDDGGLVVVDAATLNRTRTVPLSAVRPYEVRYRRRPPRSGYVPYGEDDFVHRLLDDAICKGLGVDDPYAVEFVRAHPDWTSGGVARLAYDYEQIGPVCEQALAKAGYGAESAPRQVSGFGSAVRFRHRDHRHLCPVLEKPPRDLEGWEPWSCDLERGHAGPHHHLVMDYRWTDDTDPALCGAWAARGQGRSPDSEKAHSRWVTKRGRLAGSSARAWSCAAVAAFSSSRRARRRDRNRLSRHQSTA